MTDLLDPNLNQFVANIPTVSILIISMAYATEDWKALKLIRTWARNDIGVLCIFRFNYEANLSKLINFILEVKSGDHALLQ